jgi:hypothetical protein
MLMILLNGDTPPLFSLSKMFNAARLAKADPQLPPPMKAIFSFDALAFNASPTYVTQTCIIDRLRMEIKFTLCITWAWLNCRERTRSGAWFPGKFAQIRWNLSP